MGGLNSKVWVALTTRTQAQAVYGAYMRIGRGRRKVGNKDGVISRNRNLHGSGKKEGGRIRYAIRVELILLLALGCAAMCRELTDRGQDPDSADEISMWTSDTGEAVEVTADGGYIKWVEFNVTCEAMASAYDLDVESYEKDVHLNWIELLAYVGAKTGGTFDKNSVKKIKEAAQILESGEATMEELTKDMEYYDYIKAIAPLKNLLFKGAYF